MVVLKNYCLLKGPTNFSKWGNKIWMFSEMDIIQGSLCTLNGKTRRWTFFPWENFPFPRSDSCLAEQSRVDSPDWGKGKPLREKRSLRVFFISERNLFLPHGCIFSSLDPWPKKQSYILRIPRNLATYQIRYPEC